MKNRLWIAAVVVVACLGATASAGTMTISTTPYSQNTGVGQGGEFKVTQFSGYYVPPDSKITNATGAKFHTFCIERTEFLSGIIQYNQNTEAIDGGVGGGSPDPLGKATAKLFYAWWTDQWSAGNVSVGYNYLDAGGTRAVDAEDMQLALWFLEEEITQAQLTAANNGKAQLFVDFVTDPTDAVSWADFGLQTTGIGNVRVLNTYDANGVKKQDQLVVVPLPAAGLLGLALLGGMGLVVRRRRKN